MRYHVLCCDYDGTVATHGELLPATRAALERVRGTGRKVVMVTGRRIPDLLGVCPDLSPFELIVAENGAVLYWPATKVQRTLAESPPPVFVERLRARGVTDIAVGEVVVATWHPHETVALEVIRDLGLEMQVIFNKGAVMILPSGVNKATGLAAALEELGRSRHEAVGVGDAENDHAFLALCSFGVAVSNALPMLKDRADLVTTADHGAGVEELADKLINTDLAEFADRLARHDIPIGTDIAGKPVTLPAYGATLLLAGTSGGGKSTLVTSILEQLGERQYQFCILDPEGDYSTLVGAAVVGDRQSAPTVDEVLKLLEQPTRSAVVNLVATGIENRPAFFEALLPRLLAMRAQTARPHFIVIDEAHHLAPRSAEPMAASTFAPELKNVLMVTVHPEHVSQSLLDRVDGMLTVGAAPIETLAEFSRAVGEEPPRPASAAGDAPSKGLEPQEALLWWRRPRGEPLLVRTIPPATERRRHVRKYAQGDLGPDRSFYFRGPQARLNLKAQNLTIFLQMAEGVDDATWLHHLKAGDYSRWFREGIKDDELADEAADIEQKGRKRSAVDTRKDVRAAIERRYTASA